MNIKALDYVGGVSIQDNRNWTLDEYFKYNRTKYDNLQAYINDPDPTVNNRIMQEGLKIGSEVIMEPFNFDQEDWDMWQPFTFAEAMAETNMEKRRIIFKVLGPERIFKDANPKLINRQVIKKKRTKWEGEKLTEKKYEFEDVYELYEIDAKALGLENTFATPSPVRAVRCWCTTTNREYWIMVPKFKNNQGWNNTENSMDDAIEAIAWTIQVDVDNFDTLYRQGDVIIAKMPDEPKMLTTPRPVTKEEYLEKLYSES